MDEKITCPMCGSELPTNETPCSMCGWIPEGYELDPKKKDWYYIVKSRYKGPFTPPKMRELIQDTTIKEDTLVWQEGCQFASTAGKSPFKDEFLVPITPPPYKLISDKYVKCLMTAPPFIGIIMSAFLKANIISYLLILAVFVGLGILFIKLDQKEIKKYGFDIMESWMYIGILIAPLYLLPRAERTNKKYMYSLAWLLFVLILFAR